MLWEIQENKMRRNRKLNDFINKILQIQSLIVKAQLLIGEKGRKVIFALCKK